MFKQLKFQHHSFFYSIIALKAVRHVLNSKRRVLYEITQTYYTLLNSENNNTITKLEAEHNNIIYKSECTKLVNAINVKISQEPTENLLAYKRKKYNLYLCKPYKNEFKQTILTVSGNKFVNNASEDIS